MLTRDLFAVVNLPVITLTRDNVVEFRSSVGPPVHVIPCYCVETVGRTGIIRLVHHLVGQSF